MLKGVDPNVGDPEVVAAPDRAAARVGMDALRSGDNRLARRQFETLIESGSADASVYFAHAISCDRLTDAATALRSISAAIVVEADNFVYLMLKADLLVKLGEHRGASAFYQAALGLAPVGDHLPDDVKREVARAHNMCTYYKNELEQLILARLAVTNARALPLPRIAESLDLLFGRAEAYIQRPRYFLFPGLAAIRFFDPAGFAWLSALEAETDAITAELINVMADDAAFRPYVEGNPNRPVNAQNGMLNNPEWSAFYLVKQGKVVAQNASRCPNTMQAMSSLPLTNIPNRSPSVLFSLLKPGAHIPPHNGLINTRLIVHLPLIVPPNCRFRVGSETREWVRGKAWVFDDTIEHEAWNDSNETRVILLFEIERPDISATEHQQVCAIFEAIDSHSGLAPEWDI
jgi:tetratricopeptide (TPR) repeat protein